MNRYPIRNWALISAIASAALTTGCQTTETPPARAKTAPQAAAQPPQPTAFPDRDIITYKVKPGDTLWDIGRAHKVSWSDIKAANALTSDNIFPDQELKIPVAKGSAPATPTPTAPEPANPVPEATKPQNTPLIETTPTDTLPPPPPPPAR